MTSKTAETIPAVKGFNADFACRGHRYEVGQTYEIADEPVRCTERGYHAIVGNPLDVWHHYPVICETECGELRWTRYADVLLRGQIDRGADERDSKVAAERITIVQEISLAELICRAVQWMQRLAASGYAARIAASGDDARLAASGEDAVVACAGMAATVCLGPGGCAAVAYHDGERTRFAIAYVGEGGIEAGVTYRVTSDGRFVPLSDAQEAA